MTEKKIKKSPLTKAGGEGGGNPSPLTLWSFHKLHKSPLTAWWGGGSKLNGLVH